MTLKAFKDLLENEGDKHFRLQLPNGSPVPVSFHVTEVGRIQKTFIDCGGTLRTLESCQLQVWVGEDVDHRIEARKAAAILQKASSFLQDETIPVEIEYEDQVISQYTIESHDSRANSVVLKLAHKHTECLAPELCKLPAPRSKAQAGAALETTCCGSTGCC